MFGFEPAKKPVNYSKTKQADFNLQLREPPGADRLAQFVGNRANGKAGSQSDSQIAGEVNANQAPSAAPSVAPSGSSTGGMQNSNEAFLISGSLSQGLSPNAQADSGPGQQFFGGGRDEFGAQARNAPGFGGGTGGPGGGGSGGFGG